MHAVDCMCVAIQHEVYKNRNIETLQELKLNTDCFSVGLPDIEGNFERKGAGDNG